MSVHNKYITRHSKGASKQTNEREDLVDRCRPLALARIYSVYRIDDGWDCLAVLLLLGSGRAAAPQLSAIACIMIDEGALCARVLLLDVLLHAWRRVSRLCERVSEHTSDMWCAPGTRAEEAAYGGHGTAIDHPARTALLQPIAREQERVAGMGVSQAFMARVRATGASKPRTLAASRLQGVRIKSIIDRVDIDLHLVLLELSSIRRSLAIRAKYSANKQLLVRAIADVVVVDGARR